MSLFTPDRIVGPTQRLVEYVDGQLTRVLPPGRHRGRRNATYRPVEMTERITSTSPQEVLTADGISVRVTLALRWRVLDPQAFLETAVDPFALVYLAVQVAVRDALADVDAETSVRQARRVLTEPALVAARAAATAVGIEVLETVVKDVMLPFELRAAYSQLVAARTHGQAQLEAARAETAALRSLANGAKLLDDHPALARLRLVQALPPGSTVELVSDPPRDGR